MLYIVMGGIECCPDGDWNDICFERDLKQAEIVCNELYQDECCPFDSYWVWYWVERVVSITDAEGISVPLDNIEPGDTPNRDWTLERKAISR